MASVGAACGLNIKDLGFIYFDAHDDLDSPDMNENGYFDAMGVYAAWRELENLDQHRTWISPHDLLTIPLLQSTRSK